MVKTSHKIKTLIIVFILICGYCYLIFRLSYLQIYKHHFYFSKAQTQHTVRSNLPSQRGKILDRNRLNLAISVPVPSLYGVPEKIKDINKTTAKTAKILSVNKKNIKKKLSKKTKFVWLKRKITPEQANALAKEKLEGIEFIEEIQRFYPGNNLLSHVLGFVDIDNKGLEGIEYKFNEHLSGLSGQRVSERDAAGREIVLLINKETAPKDGYHLVLTIDITIQEIVETALKATVKEFSALSGTVVVMNPKTGEILALANQPDYDINHPGKYHESLRKNTAVTDVFEPGSTFKPFILAVALEENLIDLEDRFFCEKGSYVIGSRVLHDAHPFDILTAQEIIEHSSNIGIAKIALKIGPEKLSAYLNIFGFGMKTGIELPGEVSGMLRPLNKWSKHSIYSLPMGHEISVTAIQLVTAFSALANGGFLYKPHIIKEVLDRKNNQIQQSSPELIQKVLSTATTKMVTKALCGVVSPKGTASKAQVPGYTVAGKTGTAQKTEPDGSYSHKKYISSFIGFLPSNDPEVVILVIINEPHRKHYGGTVAAPAFRTIAYQIMRYLEIPPDKEQNK